MSAKKYFVLLLALLTLVLAVAPTLAQSEPITLQMWHFAANKEATFQEWIAAYKEVEPNVTITTNVIPKDTYDETLAAALIGGNPPDLLHGLPLGDPLRHWENGQIVDLTPYVDDEWKATLYPSSLDYLTVQGRILSMSFSSNNAQVLYNADRFAELGIATPIATMDELQAAVNQLKAAGYGGALYWAQANDQAPTLFFDWARQLYPEQFAAANSGDGSWDIPEFVDLMTKINSYSDIWMPGVASLSLDESVNLFATGQASVYIIGNWAINSILAANPTFNIGVFPVPAISDQTQPVALGSMAGTWMVSSQVPEDHQQAAIAFLRWIALNGAGGEVRNIGLCPAGPAGEAALADAKPLAQELCKGQATSVPRDIFNPAVRDAMAQVIQGMINGQATPEQVMQAAQNAKARGR